MKQNELNILVFLVLIPIGFLFASHLAYYMSDALLCKSGPRGFGCFIGSFFAFIFLILSLPAFAFGWITSLVFDTSGMNDGDVLARNTGWLGLALAVGLVVLYRKALFEGAMVGGSHFAKPPQNEKQIHIPPTPAVPSQELEREIERKVTQADLERAIREMEEAKARADEAGKMG